MKFIVDNYGGGNKIETSVKIHLEDKIDLGNLYTYPQRKKVESHNFTSYTTIHWEKRNIDNDNFANYQINLPLFKGNCLQTNQIDMDFKIFSLIKIFLFCVFWIYVCDYYFTYIIP